MEVTGGAAGGGGAVGGVSMIGGASGGARACASLRRQSGRNLQV